MISMVTASTGTYTVLARRFRPQGFADVVGQGHVAQALRNAILANRVAHAYLFTGARGVGKTSTARILAKALNCPNAVDGNPCNECEICEGIAAGNDVDVLEIDGASNRGIDDIRQLRANVNVKSMRTKFKLYIIDEVHMLTKEAFNALLKTLEEPPPNVKFVFCTTEPNKLPDTILSRCQRFDFGTIETANIKGRLAQIAEAEGVQVDDDALELVARRAAGSMRDSQSIFDQLLAFGEEHITAGDVHRLLGTASDDRLIAIADSLVARDQAGVLSTFHRAIDGGVQLGELTDQILFYLRDLMVLASGAVEIELSSVGPGSREMLTKQAKQWGLQTIVAAMQILADTKGRMQRVTYGRALAELALVRIALLEDLTDLDGLIERLRSSEPVTSDIAAVEKKNELLTAEPDRDPITSAEVTLPAHPLESASDEQSRDVEPGGVEPLGVSAEDSAIAASDEPAVTHAESSETPAVDKSAESASGDSVEVATDELLGQQVDALASSVDSASSTSVGSQSLPSTDVNTVAGAAANPVSSVEPSAEEPEDSSDQESQRDAPTVVAGRILINPEDAEQIWSSVVAEISDMLKSHVKQVSKAAIAAPNKLELTFPRKYHFSKRYCEKPEVISRLEQIAARITGQHLRVSLLVGEEDGSDAASPPLDEPARQPARKRLYKPEDDDFVAVVMQTFDAECVRVDSRAGGASQAE
ncbi:DNA polymerase III subunit gamma/tau [bacterium]|nr:DNA polymerase III subunit gamma/tau [bacterium]